MAFTSLTSVLTAIGQVGGDEIVNNGISPEDAVNIALNINQDTMVDADDSIEGNDTPLIDLVIEDVANITTSMDHIDTGEEDVDKDITSTSQGQGSINYDGAGEITSDDISKFIKCSIGNAVDGC